jgi:hypothetical protein
MMAPMQGAAAGDDFHVAVGPALLGAPIHMATGAGYGVTGWDIFVTEHLLYGLALGRVVALAGRRSTHSA